MDAGIAKSIKTSFPKAYDADMKTRKGDYDKLGTCSTAIEIVNGKELSIVNAYTQFDWKGSGVLVNYDAVKSCIRFVKRNYGGKRIGIPKIGAGLARGDWDVLRAIIDDELRGEDVTLVVKDS